MLLTAMLQSGASAVSFLTVTESSVLLVFSRDYLFIDIALVKLCMFLLDPFVAFCALVNSHCTRMLRFSSDCTLDV